MAYPAAIRLPLLIVALGLVACTGGGGDAPAAGGASGATAGSSGDGGAETIWRGGPIVTVDSTVPSAEAIAVRGGRIVAVGSEAEVMKLRGAKTKVVDLEGHALLPGFLDPHSHYIEALTVASQANLYPPPAGPGKDVPAIIAALRAFETGQSLPAGAMLQAYGYDDSVMPGGRLLNRDDLDAAFPDRPVIVGHVSMHGAVLNSAALRMFDMDASTKTPPGGIIVRKPGTQEPYGLIMETAYIPIHAALPRPTRAQEAERTRAAHRLYASHGITTAHEGATTLAGLETMQRAAAAGAHSIDVIAFPLFTELDTILKTFPVDGWLRYEKGFKIGGVKITIDGSPQGRTAYFTTPYRTGGPGGQKSWRGELTMPESAVTALVRRVYGMGVPLNLHANGDGAIDVFFRAHLAASGTEPSKDRRTTVIHAQFARRDHLDLFAKYNVIPSFYTLHTYYFSDAHRKNRGAAAAAYISPMRDAIDLGIRPTNHTDFVVAPLDQLFVLWSAVTRTSRSGAVVGAGQRVTALEALQAITINAARQYREEDSKGSITVGKRADLVVLDRDPLAVPADSIRHVKVLETIKDGASIWRAP
jgi:predicted amidohydrolase YtcJ